MLWHFIITILTSNKFSQLVFKALGPLLLTGIILVFSKPPLCGGVVIWRAPMSGVYCAVPTKVILPPWVLYSSWCLQLTPCSIIWVHVCMPHILLNKHSSAVMATVTTDVNVFVIPAIVEFLPHYIDISQFGSQVISEVQTISVKVACCTHVRGLVSNWLHPVQRQAELIPVKIVLNGRIIFIEWFIRKILVINQAERFNKSPNKTIFGGKIAKGFIPRVACRIKQPVSLRWWLLVHQKLLFAGRSSLLAKFPDISWCAWTFKLVFGVLTEFGARGAIKTHTMTTALITAVWVWICAVWSYLQYTYHRLFGCKTSRNRCWS